MALKATICKLDLSITDMDRNYYDPHNLTVARHPSETDERMMVRVLAFALNAHERLQFTKGLSTEDEPELWQKSYSDEIELWIELGQPSEKRVRQACNKSNQVIVYCYGGRTAEPWWDKMKGMTTRFKNLRVVNISQENTKDLATLSSRNMQLQVTVQDGDVMISTDEGSTDITPVLWKDYS